MFINVICTLSDNKMVNKQSKKLSENCLKSPVNWRHGEEKNKEKRKRRKEQNKTKKEEEREENKG